MGKLLDELKYDLAFLKSHTLQPKWYKVVKVFILLGFLGGYLWSFGIIKTLLFLGAFLFLMLIVHFTYRIETKKYTRDWLDFTAPRQGENESPQRIGKFYYPAILFNLAISLTISQFLG
jgi:hypothetical protein